MAGSEFEARLLSLDRLGGREVDAWRALAGRSVEPNPFFTADYVLAAAPGREPPELLVAVEGETWRACLPLRRGQWGRVPFPCLAPWMPEYTFLGAPLLDAADPVRAAGALLARAVAERSVGLLVLDEYDPTAPAGRAIDEALRERGLAAIRYERWERAALRRRAEGGYLEAALSGRRRKELRRLRRGLEGELGGELQVSDRAGEPAAWEEFLALEGAGWKARSATALSSSERDAAFFRRMCDVLSAGGRLQVLALDGGGRTAAMQVNILEGEVMYGFKVAYDEALARFSPGALLEVDGIRFFHEQTGAELLDTCAHSDSKMLNRLYADRRPIGTLLVPTRGWRGRLAVLWTHAERAARRGRRLVRRRTDAAA